MIFVSDDIQLKCIQTLKKNTSCEVYICTNTAGNSQIRYTAILLKEHSLVKEFVECNSAYGYGTGDDKSSGALIASFSVREGFLLLYPYVKERNLFAFYDARSLKQYECEQICQNLVLACIQSRMPYPVLYELLLQRRINISKDLTVYIGYDVDLSALDVSRNEGDCSVECARIILELLDYFSNQQIVSHDLLRKRVKSAGYTRFTQLYKDLTISAVGSQKISIISRIRAFWIRNKDALFRVLLVLCMLAGIIALVTLVSQLIWGEVPWLRLFYNNFKQIGTESLVR